MLKARHSLLVCRPIRIFDYDTISDVIMQISYTAEDDITFREEVEKLILDKNRRNQF
jgi:hypothetical protein